jgi:hypothetical protein
MIQNFRCFRRASDEMDVSGSGHGGSAGRTGPLLQGDRAMSTEFIGLNLAKPVFQEMSRPMLQMGERC